MRIAAGSEIAPCVSKKVCHSPRVMGLSKAIRVGTVDRVGGLFGGAGSYAVSVESVQAANDDESTSQS